MLDVMKSKIIITYIIDGKRFTKYNNKKCWNVG